MKKVLMMMIAALTLAACGKQQSVKEEPKGLKVLVLYYSQTNHTKTVAEEIQKQLGADIEAITAIKPYNGSFEETVNRCKKEMETGEIPEINPITSNIKDYDVIFIGFPVWCGTYAQPIASLVKSTKFEGKNIVTFCTYGSGGLDESMQALKKALPDATVADYGFGIRDARMHAVEKEISRFLMEYGYKDGNYQPLPEFSELKAVTDAEKEIFQKACGDYRFPLGTPVKVGSRKTPDGTEYMFKASSSEGKGSVSTIYVTANKGEKPEFTLVTR